MSSMLPGVFQRALSLVISHNEEGKLDDLTTLSPSSTIDTRLGVVIKTPQTTQAFRDENDEDGRSLERNKNISCTALRRDEIKPTCPESSTGTIIEKNTPQSPPDTTINSTKQYNSNQRQGQDRRRKALRSITNQQSPSIYNRSKFRKSFERGEQTNLNVGMKRTIIDRSRKETPKGLTRRHAKEIRSQVMKGLKPRCLDEIRCQVNTILENSMNTSTIQNLGCNASNLSIGSHSFYRVSTLHSLDLTCDLMNHSFGSSSSSYSSSSSKSQFMQYFYQQVHSFDSSSVNDQSHSGWSCNSSQQSVLSQFVAVSPDLTIGNAKTAVGAFAARSIEGEKRFHSFELRQKKAPLTAVGAWVERQMLYHPTG